MRRKRRTAGEWREVLSAYNASELSGVAFCEANGIGQKSFYRARGKYGDSAPESTSGFVQLSGGWPASSASSSPIELILPHCKVRLDGEVSPVWLADLVKSLAP